MIKMNDRLAYELIEELHNINLNLMELTDAIKGKNNVSDKHEQQQSEEPINIDLVRLFSNAISSYCICDGCVNNNDGKCSKNMPLYKKCQVCMYYINDAVYRPILPEGVDQV